MPSNAILRFQKSSNAHHDSQTKNIPYALGGSFIGVFRGLFGLVFPDCPGQGGGFAFQAASEFLASIGPGIGQTLSSLDILESCLSLLNNEGTSYFDEIFSQAFSRACGSALNSLLASLLRLCSPPGWCFRFYSCLSPLVTMGFPGGKMARGPWGVAMST